MQPTEAAARGAAARALVADDARWLIDVAMSAANDEKTGPLIGLAFIGHFSRVAYEGSRIAESPDPSLGVPVLAELLTGSHADIIERARHATKLLDDNKKDVEAFQSEITSYLTLHRSHFFGNVRPLFRFLETDLGLLHLNRRVLMGSITSEMRYGLRGSVGVDELGSSLNAVATELGGVAVVLAALDGKTPSTDGTLDLSVLRKATYTDHKSKSYLQTRFDSGMTEASKLLLLLVEGEVNLAASVLPTTSRGHEAAALRARFVVGVHAVHAIQKILDSVTNATDARTDSVRQMINDPATQVFVQHAGARQLRNQCVHYRLRDDISELNPAKPMFGLVEELWPGQTFDQVEIDTSSLLDRLSDVLHGWCQD